MYEEDKSDEENDMVLMTDGDMVRQKIKRNSTILEPKVSSMIIQKAENEVMEEQEQLESDSQEQYNSYQSRVDLQSAFNSVNQDDSDSEAFGDVTAEEEQMIRQRILNRKTAKQQEEEIRKNSKYGELETWKLFRMIVKSGDDLRGEEFAM